MNKEQEQQICETIDKAIEKTKQSIKDYSEMAQPIAPENAIGRISRMDAINNKSVMDAALRQAKEKLKKLEYVKAQLGKDGFGICKRCGKAIPIGRIILMPQSILCVQCAR